MGSDNTIGIALSRLMAVGDNGTLQIDNVGGHGSLRVTHRFDVGFAPRVTAVHTTELEEFGRAMGSDRLAQALTDLLAAAPRGDDSE